MRQVDCLATAAPTQRSSQAPQQQYSSAMQTSWTHPVASTLSASGPPVTQGSCSSVGLHVTEQAPAMQDLVQQSLSRAQAPVEQLPVQTPVSHWPVQQSAWLTQRLPSFRQAGTQ